MDYEELKLIVTAIEKISTEIFFLWILHIMEDFVTTMTFYIILMIFAYKLFGVFAAHLTVKRMGDKMGYHWPYSDGEKRRLYQVFDKGLEWERRANRAKARPAPVGDGR